MKKTKFTFYSETKAIKSEYDSTDDVLTEMRVFSESGILIRKKYFEDGIIRDGTSDWQYYDTGELRATESFKDGKHNDNGITGQPSCISYYKNGIVSWYGYYKNGYMSRENGCASQHFNKNGGIYSERY